MNKRIVKGTVVLMLLALFFNVFSVGCTVNKKVLNPGPGQADSESNKDNEKNTDTENAHGNNVQENVDKDEQKTEGSNQQQKGEDQKGEDQKEDDNIKSEVTLNSREVKDVKVKGLYLTSWTVSDQGRVKKFIDIANNTEINTYVIDIKDDDGIVAYETNIPSVRDVNGWESRYNPTKVLNAFHENDIRVIGRIVCFKDPVLSSKKTDLAVKKTDGSLYTERDYAGRTITWLNPYNKESWQYLVDIAKEAVNLGFDEIQFDYIRFPNDGNKKTMYFGEVDKEKYEAINAFIAFARKQLPGVILSADVFGIICESPGDVEQIGQNLEYIGRELDYISPMVYPSHYALGQTVNGVNFPKPDLDPYGVVYNSIAKARDRISKVEGYQASIRPYLQDFTASWIGKGNYQKYGPQQAREQIKAVYDAGYEEWIFWSANNSYSLDAFKKD